jgi:2-methylcitrate dehydratase PrpD
MDVEIAKKLSRFAIGTKYEDIPEEVLQLTKGMILKTVAGMLAGSINPSSMKLAKLIRDRRLPEEAGVIGSGFKTSLWEATLLNAFFAHASELEDDFPMYGIQTDSGRRLGGGAWDITVIPLLVSLGEKLRLSGKALLEAITVGLEVHVRTCLFSAEHLGFVIVPGAVGPALGAARPLGLSIDKTMSAVGLSMQAVPCVLLNVATDAHFLESALQSLHGLIAAEMAKEGMTGNPDIGTFLSKYLGEQRVFPEEIVEGLGKRWLIYEVLIKKYPCCIHTHRYIDAVIELREKHDLSYEKLETIEAHTGLAENALLNRPEPKTESDLGFSFQHVLACAMLDGDVTLEHTTHNAMTASRLREARAKVKVIPHPEWLPGMMVNPASITIKMNDGRVFSKERTNIIGSQKEPLTMKQFRELYTKFTRGILTKEQISRTVDVILDLEKLTNVKELIDMLVFVPKV